MSRNTRIVGERGQITVPKRLRERFGIRGGDEVVVGAEDEKIVIARRTVDDRLEEGYREWRDRDRAVVTTSDGSNDRDGSDGAPRRGDETADRPDDAPAW